MKLPFQNKRKQPQPIIGNLYNQETVAVPAMPVPEPTVKTVEPELVQICACCGMIGATIPLKVSYFGFIALPFVKICEACENNRQARHKQHYIPMRKTVLEHPAVKKAMEIA